eukprot:gene2920-3077_t
MHLTLRKRSEALEERAEPLLKWLDAEGVAYLHPADELAGVLVERMSQCTAMRAHLNKADETRIHAERE